MKVVLPWPDRRLSPNARVHWRAKAAVVKKARWDAAYLALEAAGGSLSEIRRTFADQARIPLLVRFYAPDRRLRDDDNAVGAFKSYRDGLADALGIDDRRFSPRYEFADPEAPGRVEVSLG